MIIEERSRLIKALNQLPNVIKVYASETNFILIKIEKADKIYASLKALGTIIRNRSSVVPNGLRITVGTPSENTILIEQLKQLSV